MTYCHVNSPISTQHIITRYVNTVSVLITVHNSTAIIIIIITTTYQFLFDWTIFPRELLKVMPPKDI